LTARLNSSHWGAFSPVVRDGRLIGARPFANDPDPSDIISSLPDAVHHGCRVMQPAVREGWLRNRPDRARELRGQDSFIPVTWERALDLVEGALKQVIATDGNRTIFGGSYGWASAGRFHHAKSQLQRFLALIGGFVGTRDTYSTAAGSVLLKHVVGDSQTVAGGTDWQSIADHSQLVVSFGGIPLRNTQVTPGGAGEHLTRRWLEQVKAAGVAFCCISPLRDDAPAFLEAEWLAPRPNSDTALMLALAHTLLVENLHDVKFLERYTVGFRQFSDYLTGRNDGCIKDARWAAELTEIPADTICRLARRMASTRTFLMANWSLQRSDHGEQPFWALIALGAMLGQIGLPGGGVGFGYGSMGGVGISRSAVPIPTLHLGHNRVRSFIPVARIADMLLNPGQPFQYDGRDLTYPNIRLIYWCGGNPFHHHQDLNRLVLAWRQPETIIVNEPWWTATARHADIVLPSTTTLERNDIGASPRDRFIVAMKQAIEPIGESRDDFAIFSELARRFEVLEQFTEGRSAIESVRHLYLTARAQGLHKGIEWPEFDDFWESGYVEIPETSTGSVGFEQFRRNPVRYKLATPSGRIELFSEKIASFNYDDCLGHPAWLEPAEWLGGQMSRVYPLHLLTTQPSTRLHGQMDMGRVSQQSKIRGREPMRISPFDAAQRGICAGDVVKVFNDRGAILAGVVVTENVRPGVIQISTGAWYDPHEPGIIGTLDKHGNPNVLTLDKGTSRLAQGPTAQTTLVEVEKYVGDLPGITAFEPPLKLVLDVAVND
jgi:biotin/methionine sulfoxide reductase